MLPDVQNRKARCRFFRCGGLPRTDAVAIVANASRQDPTSEKSLAPKRKKRASVNLQQRRSDERQIAMP
jgi:hypothetical protein